MRSDPVKDYLQSAKWAHADAVRLREKVEQLEAQVYKMTPAYTGMPGGGGSTVGASSAWAALADLHAEYLEKLAAAERREKEVSDFIDELDTPVGRAILHLRYCQGLSWPAVVEGLNKSGVYYSDRNIFRLHGVALNEARQKYMEGNYDQKRNT